MIKDRIILGIDPGTIVMGYGLLRVENNKPALDTMGVLQLNKYEDHYLRLRKIFERVLSLIDQYHPDELAIEAPFFGKNVQSMLKLGRAQGVAMAAALERDIPIFEYAPLKIKMAITGRHFAIICRPIVHRWRRNIPIGRISWRRIRVKYIDADWRKERCGSNGNNNPVDPHLLYWDTLFGNRLLNDTLSHHCLSHFHEAGDIRAFHVVDIVAFTSMLNALVVDAAHDLVQFSVNLFRCP